MRELEFPNGEPDYWYVEYGVKEKILEIRLGPHTMKIPQETVLHWFMQEEYNNRRRDGKTD